MRLADSVVPVVALWLLAGCASVTEDIRVQTESRPGLDLGNYRTYRWLSTAEIAPDTHGNWEPPGLDADAEIRALLNRELRRRGMREGDSDAQLVVGFGAGINPEVFEIVENPDSKMYALQNAPRAALVVVFIDSRTRQPVWVGTAVGDVKAGRSADEVRRRIDYAVTSMLRQTSR